MEHLEQHTRTHILAFKALKNYVFSLVATKVVHDLSCLPPKLNYLWQRIREALGSKNVPWSRPSRIGEVTQESSSCSRFFFITSKGTQGFCVQGWQNTVKESPEYSYEKNTVAMTLKALDKWYLWFQNRDLLQGRIFNSLTVLLNFSAVFDLNEE